MKPAPEPLESDEVRVFYAWCDGLQAPSIERCLQLLSADERERYQRFHFEHDRHSYLAAHALTRAVLAPLAGLPPPDLQFEAGAHGRPELCQPASGPRLRFNLSHTRGLVACAVALGHAIGVDVEHVERRADIDQLAPAVFSQRERAELAELASDAKRERFFRLWTLKEAYIKAVGKGLSLPLRSITLELPGGEPPRLHFAAPLRDDGAQWWLNVHAPGPSHVLAIALNVAPPVRATIHEWSPWESA
jgi:4'-phosphopantetheinyl transferase